MATQSNPYSSPEQSPAPPPKRRIGTIPALIGVFVLVEIFAVLASPEGDPFSMIMLQIPGLALGLTSFALGRLSSGRPGNPAE